MAPVDTQARKRGVASAPGTHATGRAPTIAPWHAAGGFARVMACVME